MMSHVFEENRVQGVRIKPPHMEKEQSDQESSPKIFVCRSKFEQQRTANVHYRSHIHTAPYAFDTITNREVLKIEKKTGAKQLLDFIMTLEPDEDLAKDIEDAMDWRETFKLRDSNFEE